jgi:diguanylate cyclase (GGDEF)-like protein
MDDLEPADDTQARILVVDDDAINLRVLRHVLTAYGYQVEAASHGREALEKALADPPDVILLDVMMPEMSGYDVFKSLREHSRTADVPVIFVSARGSVSDRVKGLELGAQDYVAKPYDPEELRARIRAVLRTKCDRDRLLAERESLAAQSVTDALTGVYNRRYLESRLGEEVARARRYGLPLGCMMIDLDHFKDINDRYGHQVGDQVLRGVAALMQSNLRVSDILARYGGEEFTVLATETGLEGTAATAEKLRSLLDTSPIPTDAGPLRITVSIGVAALRPEEGASELLRRADLALYRAKEAGRNRVQVAEA